ncbi:MAG: hypothetical protein IPI66_11035 [Chitinophagaceae bacterium]|nr:hypothetical protein [Chitinophagaceae bacterium]MBL0056560.1 hypothetical protein [Chitinophagaceae bacterium]
MQPSENLLNTDLQVDAEVQQHLSDAAKWARFIAIVGFVLCGILVLAELITVFDTDFSVGRRSNYDTRKTQEISPVFSLVILFVFTLLWFFVSLYTYRFAVKMRSAIANTDQFSFTDSMHNLARTYRFLGIVTIVYLALIVLGVIAGVFSTVMK